MTSRFQPIYFEKQNSVDKLNCVVCCLGFRIKYEGFEEREYYGNIYKMFRCILHELRKEEIARSCGTYK